jgi:hypothetical protein
MYRPDGNIGHKRKLALVEGLPMPFLTNGVADPACGVFNPRHMRDRAYCTSPGGEQEDLCAIAHIRLGSNKWKRGMRDLAYARQLSS